MQLSKVPTYSFIDAGQRSIIGDCNTPGVCHLLSTRFELKHEKFSGNKEVKVNL